MEIFWLASSKLIEPERDFLDTGEHDVYGERGFEETDGTTA
jgi:hypothetical protein